MVKMSFRYICTGSSVLSPSVKAAVGAVGPGDHVACSKARAEVVGDQPAHLLRLEVVGVVVAVRQHVGADEDAPLHLRRRSPRRASGGTCRGGRGTRRRGGRSARRRSARGSTRPPPARSRSRPGTERPTRGSVDRRRSSRPGACSSSSAAVDRARRRRRRRRRRRTRRAGRCAGRPAASTRPRGGRRAAPGSRRPGGPSTSSRARRGRPSPSSSSAQSSAVRANTPGVSRDDAKATSP